MGTNFIDTHTDNLQFVVKPTQLVNAWWWILIAMIIALTSYFSIPSQTKWILISVPLFISLVKGIITHCWMYRFNEKTISERKGVFSVHTREIHYSRVKSVRLDEPFYLRIFGIYNVLLITSDPYIPVFKIYGIWVADQGNGMTFMDMIKKNVSKWRNNRGVDEHDIHPLM